MRVLKEDEKYLLGTHNIVMRYYFYLEKGMDILNEFRNLFLGIFAVYLVLHLSNWWWLVAMFIPAIIVLVVVGRYNVHRLSKMKEWLNLRFSTHYGIKSFNFSQGQYEQLVAIKKLINDRLRDTKTSRIHISKSGKPRRKSS